MALGPSSRWAASALTWTAAPAIGLALLNLPYLLQLQTHRPSGALAAVTAGLFVLAVGWSVAAWTLAQGHEGVARAAHLGACAGLLACGLFYPYIQGLIAHVTSRDA